MEETKQTIHLNDKPYGVILDTNVLIYLFQPDIIDNETFDHFLGSIIMQAVKLIIPEQVKAEWDKHKVQRNEEYLQNAAKAIERHEKLAEHMPSQSERDQFLEQIEFLKKMAERKYRYTYGLRSRNIDDIINEPIHSIIPARDRHVEKRIVELSINKKPPFFGSDVVNSKAESKKNEIADAVIFFTAYEFVKKYRNDYKKVFFISVNKTDFCVNGNPAKLHANIEPFADEVGIEFLNDIGRFLKEIDSSNFNKFNFHTEDASLYLTDDYFEECPNCEGGVHVNADSKLISSREHPHGTYQYICQHCKHKWDSGITPLDSIY